MPYYRIVSSAVRAGAPLGYKGIYRMEPDFQNDDGEEIHNLWYRYVSYYERSTPLGVTDELSIDELLHFCEMLNKKRDIDFEVICIDNEFGNINKSLFYGVDVSSIGGYSMIGDGFFKINTKNDKNAEKIYNINKVFESKLNQYGLFRNTADAQLFLNILSDFQSRYLVEPEDSYIWYISRVR